MSVILTNPNGSPTRMLICCDDRNYGLVETFNSLAEQLENKEFNLAVFLRDKRIPIPPKRGRMMLTVRAKRRFETAGGHYVEMPYRWMADLYGLYRTRLAIGSQDLSYASDQSGTIGLVRHEHFDDYFSNRYASELIGKMLSLVEPSVGQVDEPPEIDRGQLLKSILQLLNCAPFVYTLDRINEYLAQKYPNIVVPDHVVLEVIGSAEGQIHQITAKPPIYSARVNDPN